MDESKIRAMFPFLRREIKGKKIIYLDSTASSQKPDSVIDSLVDTYSSHYANIHRGVHKLSQEASSLFEEAHKKVGKFINAAHPDREIIFTKNTTESLNFIARGLDWKIGDEVIISEMEHHSNIVPWFMLAKDRGVVVKFAPVSKEGILDTESLESMITPRTRLISIVHVSNFLGTINPIEKISRIAKKHKVLLSVDGAQSAPHMEIDVRKLGCDFFSFSSHKMCGPTGVGVLYAREELLQKMAPLIGGGDMISKVSYSGFEYNRLPWKFEAGTGPIAEGIAFGVAIDFLQKVGMKDIEKHDKELVSYVYNEMRTIPGVEIYGPCAESRSSLISFNVRGISPHEVAGILDDQSNIAIRSGFHCVEPLQRKMGLSEGSARVSFYLYNTKEEADTFLNELRKIAKTFS